jgi:hypothetical protein
MEMKVYSAINAIQGELSKVGISKDSRNQQQGYNFRGIDAVYNALSPLLAKHGLCILPRILKRECVERQTAKGGVIFYVTVEAEFDFVSAEDGSKHVVRTFGEAMDSADKATNKAMSAAYKYAAFQAFAIPTEGDNDADAHTPEIVPNVRVTPLDTVWDSLDAPTQAGLEALAMNVREYLEAGDAKGAYERIERDQLIPDEKAGLWGLLNSSERSALKKAAEAAKKAA